MEIKVHAFKKILFGQWGNIASTQGFAEFRENVMTVGIRIWITRGTRKSYIDSGFFWWKQEYIVDSDLCANLMCWMYVVKKEKTFVLSTEEITSANDGRGNLLMLCRLRVNVYGKIQWCKNGV